MAQIRAGAKAQVKVGVQASPGLKLLARMLELNVQQLEQLLAQELEENPALEPTDESQPFTPAFQPVIISTDTSDPDEDVENSWFEEEEASEEWLAVPPLELKEHVREQLLLNLPSELHPIADYLVESLNPRGYLQASVEEVALQLNCSPEAVMRVLAELQRCDPPGVGARDLRECMLIQLRALMGNPQVDQELVELTYRVVKDAWHELTSARLSAVARKLKTDEATIQRVLRFIRNTLSPYPGDGFGENLTLSTESPPIEPDIIVRYRKPAGLSVELRGPSPETIRLSRSYAEQYLVARRADSGGEKSFALSREEREHIFQYVSRARIFLQALQQRQQTLKRIMEVLVQRQFPFLFTGDPRFLQPMTRAELAEATGLHRSTVGRAVRNKWLQLPSGSLVPLDVFFDASYRVAMLIHQIIDENECGGRSLTDAEIADKLAEMGIHIARRTVSKYRNRHRILPSRWRERSRLIG